MSESVDPGLGAALAFAIAEPVLEFAADDHLMPPDGLWPGCGGRGVQPVFAAAPPTMR
jgi:hypothetical protein